VTIGEARVLAVIFAGVLLVLGMAAAVDERFERIGLWLALGAAMLFVVTMLFWAVTEP
jgi:hypothetical protein